MNFVSSFWNVSLLACNNMFTNPRISNLVCCIHGSICIVVLNFSNVAFVSCFCIFGMYVFRSMKNQVLCFFISIPANRINIFSLAKIQNSFQCFVLSSLSSVYLLLMCHRRMRESSAASFLFCQS